MTQHDGLGPCSHGYTAKDHSWEPSLQDGQTIADLSQVELLGQALGAASACWEKLEAAGVFQSERCVAILDKVDAELSRRGDEAQLGLATTRELLMELKVRFEVPTPYPLRAERMQMILDQLPNKALDYRTVDSNG